MGGGRLISERGLLNLAKTIVSSPERTKLQSGKAQVRVAGGHADLLLILEDQ